MSRSGNVRDNVAMESFFSSLKTERIGRKVYRAMPPGPTCSITSSDSPTIAYVSPLEFERKVGLA
jgi:putative transposase